MPLEILKGQEMHALAQAPAALVKDTGKGWQLHSVDGQSAGLAGEHSAEVLMVVLALELQGVTTGRLRLPRPRSSW